MNSRLLGVLLALLVIGLICIPPKKNRVIGLMHEDLEILMMDLADENQRLYEEIAKLEEQKNEDDEMIKDLVDLIWEMDDKHTKLFVKLNEHRKKSAEDRVIIRRFEDDSAENDSIMKKLDARAELHEIVAIHAMIEREGLLRENAKLYRGVEYLNTEIEKLNGELRGYQVNAEPRSLESVPATIVQPLFDVLPYEHFSLEDFHAWLSCSDDDFYEEEYLSMDE